MIYEEQTSSERLMRFELRFDLSPMGHKDLDDIRLPELVNHVPIQVFKLRFIKRQRDCFNS